MGRGCVSLLPASAVMLLIVCSTASAQDRQPDRTLFEAALPGGIHAALATLGDRTTPDRSQFLLEVIRRFYSNPLIGPADQRFAPVRALAAQLDAAPTTSNEDTLPLPLPPEVWTQVMFAGRPPSRTLVSAILQSGRRARAILFDRPEVIDRAMASARAIFPQVWSEIAKAGNGVLTSAVLGGSPLGEDLGYGPPRVLNPSEVKQIATALSAITIEQFESAFDPAAMDAAEIYPQIWERDGKEALEYLTHFFPGVVTFYAEAAGRGDGVVLWLA